MRRWVDVYNQSRGGVTLARAFWCESSLCRMRGLTFRRRLAEGEGLLLVGSKDSAAEAAIHMFWVFMPLAVVWINSEMRVVDCRLARPWRLYVPAAPARYVLEGAVTMLDHVGVGDELRLVDPAQG